MLKMPTYNKNTHTKGKKKIIRQQVCPFYSILKHCNAQTQSRSHKGKTNKHTQTNKQKKRERSLKKKSLAAAQQSATTSDPQHRREGLLVGKQFGQEQRPPRSAQSQRRYAQQRQ